WLPSVIQCAPKFMRVLECPVRPNGSVGMLMAQSYEARYHGPAMDRPRTLEEAIEFLLDRLRIRRSPMALVDPARAEAAIRALPGLDGEAWGDAWGSAGAEYERPAEGAERRGGRA